MYFFTVVFFRDADGGMGLLGMGLLINRFPQAPSAHWFHAPTTARRECILSEHKQKMNVWG